MCSTTRMCGTTTTHPTTHTPVGGVEAPALLSQNNSTAATYHHTADIVETGVNRNNKE
jgi:hypothetical protein